MISLLRRRQKPTGKLGSTCAEAYRLLTGARNDTRGDPEPVMRRAAEIASAMTGRPFTASDLVLIMVAVKLARERVGKRGDRDNIVDAVSYLSMLGDFKARELTRTP